MFDRLTILDALRRLVEREGGVDFQRLTIALLREAFNEVVPNQLHNDLGADATVRFRGVSRLVCISLSFSSRKVESDIRRSLDNRPLVRDFLFITAAKVSNQKLQTIIHELESRLECTLVILEQSWIVSECLRPFNAFTVSSALHLNASRTTGDVEVIVGPIEIVSRSPATNFVDAAIDERAVTAVLGHLPSASNDERIDAFLFEKEQTSSFFGVATGADPTVLKFAGQTFISFVRIEDSSFSLFVGCLIDGRIQKARIKRHLPRLCGPPTLHVRDGSLAVTWVTQRGPTLHSSLLAWDMTKGISVSAESSDTIGGFNYSSSEPVVTFDESGCYVVTMGTDCITIYSFDKQIKRIGSRPHRGFGALPARVAAVVRSRKIVLAVDTPGECLTTLLFDVVTGEFGEPKIISAGGKFPSLSLIRNQVAIAWVGGAPIPSALLKGVEPESGKMIGIALNSSTRQEMAQQLLEEIDEADLMSVPLVPVWAPVWIGVLNDEAQCVSSYGPLGLVNFEHDFIKLTLASNCGLLIWRAVGEHSHTVFARRLMF
jgi:hypothetical protein